MTHFDHRVGVRKKMTKVRPSERKAQPSMPNGLGLIETNVMEDADDAGINTQG